MEIVEKNFTKVNIAEFFNVRGCYGWIEFTSDSLSRVDYEKIKSDISKVFNIEECYSPFDNEYGSRIHYALNVHHDIDGWSSYIDNEVLPFLEKLETSYKVNVCGKFLETFCGEHYDRVVIYYINNDTIIKSSGEAIFKTSTFDSPTPLISTVLRKPDTTYAWRR